MQWSAQQETALKSVKEWLRSRSRSQQIFRLFGFAGTGKTTLEIEIAHMTKKPLFASFTGKAALVMQRKGCHGASTIHSLIYKVRQGLDGVPEFILDKDSPLGDASLLIVDEVSMVGEELARDVLSFGCPVMAIGDPAQLPPVKDAGFFTDAQPDVMLTEIHRQARDNPIVRLANDVREGRRLELGEYKGVVDHHFVRVIKRDDLKQSAVMTADQCLVGLNRTRHDWNRKMRRALTTMGKLDAEDDRKPVIGDRLVCLRNKADKGLLNGQLWIVKEILEPKARDSNVIRMIVKPDDADLFQETEVIAPLERFGSDDKLPAWRERALDMFDFGYALTVHKSQGSQWNNVLIMDESFAFKEFRNRHLYTAVTRAAERLTVVKH